MSTTVLRVRRQDHKADPSHLLVHIEHIGRNDFDLKLICTDHEHLYHASMKESSVKSLQGSNFTGDLDQWKATLAYAFLHRQPTGPLPEFLSGVELVAKIASKSTVSITVRRNVGGITQNLGGLDLEQDDEREEIDVFKWVDVAAATTDDLRLELEQSRASSASRQDEISRLTAELDRLVAAKREHEDELLSKFAALLNTKKLKIRDQQRLLSRAKVDSELLADVRAARTTTSKKPRKVGASRGAKRKANADSVHESEDQGEDDDATDDGGSEGKAQETPSNSGDDATEGEDEEEDEDADAFAPAPAASQISGRALRSQTTTKESQPQGSDDMDIDGGSALPPRRELPFGNKKAGRKGPTPPSPKLDVQQTETNDDDDEETDDEL